MMSVEVVVKKRQDGGSSLAVQAPFPSAKLMFSSLTPMFSHALQFDFRGTELRMVSYIVF